MDSYPINSIVLISKREMIHAKNLLTPFLTATDEEFSHLADRRLLLLGTIISNCVTTRATVRSILIKNKLVMFATTLSYQH